MPAAAVIPAPIAYIKVVAVKKLVVELLVGGHLLSEIVVDYLGHPLGNHRLTSMGDMRNGIFTLKKLECFRQAYARILQLRIME